tara:strand:- start:105 stop:299 length:195 start_codon:yes stop_codon:yes gene_type:complete
MLFRRFVFGVLMRAAQNPAVQKKAGELAGKALRQAQPTLLQASRTAGELTRKAKQKMFDKKNQR